MGSPRPLSFLSRASLLLGVPEARRGGLAFRGRHHGVEQQLIPAGRSMSALPLDGARSSGYAGGSR